MDDIFKEVCVEKLVYVYIPYWNRWDTNETENVISYGRIGDCVK